MVLVLDTNVLTSALRSRKGASFRLLSLVGTGRFDIALSVPLVLEYEGVAGEKLAAWATEEYLAARAGRGDRVKFEAALSRVPDREPEPEDTI